MPGPTTYFELLTAAVNDMAEHGFDSVERIKYWTDRLRETAEHVLLSNAQMEQMLRDTLAGVYRRLVDQNQILVYHKGVSRYTLERLRPHLRAELDRRIMASAQLIRLNREEAIEKTLRRFSGWSTSIPKGGSRTTDKVKQKQEIRKSLTQLPFEARRVLIDQGHKLTASINEVVAKDGGALAGIWRSHWRQIGYNYREDHKEQDGKVYVVRGNWALKAGLMVRGENPYYDEIEAVAVAPFCRCYMTWLYNLRQLPTEMLTKKGQQELARAKALVDA